MVFETKMKLLTTRAQKIGCFLKIFMILSVIYLYPHVLHYLHKNEEITKSNLVEIKIALEQYSENRDGSFPHEIDGLIQNYYFPNGFPMNPYSETPMSPCDFGDDVEPGNFTYVPVYRGKEEGEFPFGYYLFAYCEESQPGLDITDDGIPDHVIMLLIPNCVKEYEMIPVKYLLNPK